MAESCLVQLEPKYNTDEEVCLSDDSEVSVANMNRNNNDREVISTEIEDEKSCVINEDEVDNEIVSDDEYNYSEDSICSDDSYKRSEITNVTPRSLPSAGSPLKRTMSLEYPIGRRSEINGENQSTYRRQLSDNVRRICSSANDNRYSSRNNAPRLEVVKSRARRRNMSFTNAEMRRIEVENQYLLKKIMAQQKPQNKPTRTQSVQPRVSSSAINRGKLQRRIEEENMMLLRRIQDAKSCAVSSNVIPGYRLTSL